MTEDSLRGSLFSFWMWLESSATRKIQPGRSYTIRSTFPLALYSAIFM